MPRPTPTWDTETARTINDTASLMALLSNYSPRDPRDREDLRGYLAVEILSRWRSYDPSRACPATFADRVARSAVRTWHDARMAQKRGRRHVHLDLDDLTEVLGADGDDTDLALDVRGFFANLDDDDRRLVGAVADDSVLGAARTLGLSRGTARRRLAAIRTQAEAAGLGVYREAA